QAILSMGLEHGSNRCKNYYLSPLKSSHMLNIYSYRRSTMHTGNVFENNRTQAVHLPVDVRFDDSVKKVVIRKLDKDRILTPVDHAWDSFFHAADGVSEDFLPEHASQQQAEREEFERVAGLRMENWVEQ